MTRYNKANSLRKLCEDLSAGGLIDVLVIKSSPIWVPIDKGNAYNSLVESYFGVRGIKSWKGFLEDYSDFGEEAAEIAHTIREIKSRHYNFFVNRVPTIPFDEIPRLYTDHHWNLGRTHCPVPYVEPTIESDGNV
jgi:hypothetical protein